MRPRRSTNPLILLSIAMGSASRNIHDFRHRKIAEEEAARIRKGTAEQIGASKKGEAARLGRALMARLSTIKPEDFQDTAEALRGYADAISARFEITSEEKYVGRRQKRSTG